MIPFRTTVVAHGSPVATMAIIVANVALFFIQRDMSSAQELRFVYSFGLVPAFLADGAIARSLGLPDNGWLPLVTNTFMHGGYLHLIINMWTLWLFGVVVEDRVGSVTFAAIYVVCGVAGSLLHVAFNLESNIPLVGASGAIAGLLAAFVRLFPRAHVLVVQPIFVLPLFFRLPAVLFAVLWFALQFAFAALWPQSEGVRGGIAWWAHIGGFAAGLLLATICVQRTPRPGPWQR